MTLIIKPSFRINALVRATMTRGTMCFDNVHAKFFGLPKGTEGSWNLHSELEITL